MPSQFSLLHEQNPYRHLLNNLPVDLSLARYQVVTAVFTWTYRREAVATAEQAYDQAQPDFERDRQHIEDEIHSLVGRGLGTGPTSTKLRAELDRYYAPRVLQNRLNTRRLAVQRAMLRLIEIERELDPTPAVAIVGSREYPNPHDIYEFVRQLPTGTLVVSGGAPGVDTWAAQVAADCGLPTMIYPAEWERYGQVAGYHRNLYIAARAHRMVAFWNRQSRGTNHAVQMARELGRPVEVYTPQGVRSA